MIFDDLAYGLRLRLYFWKQDRSARYYDRLLLAARNANKGREEYEKIITERIFEDDQIQTEIDLRTT